MASFKPAQSNRGITNSKSHLAKFTRAAILGAFLIGSTACETKETVQDFSKVCAKAINVYRVGVGNPFIAIDMVDQSGSRRVSIYGGEITKINDEWVEVKTSDRDGKIIRIKFNKVTNIEKSPYTVLIERGVIEGEVMIWLAERSRDCI